VKTLRCAVMKPHTFKTAEVRVGDFDSAIKPTTAIGQQARWSTDVLSFGTNRFIPCLVSCESKTIEQSILEANSRSDNLVSDIKGGS
jgi:hypothetical protein